MRRLLGIRNTEHVNSFVPMKSSSEYTPTLSFGLLILGPPKIGKTTLALQFPSPYIADCDNNLSGPASFLKANNLPAFSYDVINIDDGGKEVSTTQRWSRLTSCLKAAVENPNIKTIVVDSLSSISDYLIEHILSTEGQKTMRIQDWQPFQFMMKRLITYLRSSRKLIIFIGHESTEKDEVDGIIKYFILVPTRLKDNLGGMFSDVWRIECEQTGDKKYTYSLRTKPTVRFALGTSLINLPPVLPASFAEIKKYAPQLDPA
jgi:AAA domain